jgi:hypothetical protein
MQKRREQGPAEPPRRARCASRPSGAHGFGRCGRSAARPLDCRAYPVGRPEHIRGEACPRCAILEPRRGRKCARSGKFRVETPAQRMEDRMRGVVGGPSAASLGRCPPVRESGRRLERRPTAAPLCVPEPCGRPLPQRGPLRGASPGAARVHRAWLRSILASRKSPLAAHSSVEVRRRLVRDLPVLPRRPSFDDAVSAWLAHHPQTLSLH